MILILNGPNLNLVGTREPRYYGLETFDSMLDELRSIFKDEPIEYLQSNHEGVLIDALHKAGANCDGVVFNAGAYAHTSLVLGDAVAAIKTPVIEVHLSNVFEREEVRHRSYIAASCIGSISGFGKNSYYLAVHHLLRVVKKRSGGQAG